MRRNRVVTVLPFCALISFVVCMSANADNATDNIRKITSVRRRFTTKSYKAAALSALLEDVNRFVHDLELNEKQPLAAVDLSEIIIQPPFMTDSARMFGCIASKHYSYCASKDNKLWFITRNFEGGEAGREKDLKMLRTRYARPKAEMDTNAAYRLATQWLAKASIDVVGLEHDSIIEIKAMDLGTKFVPLYQIRWLQPLETTQEVGNSQGIQTVAYVELLEPEKELRGLRVSNPAYIKRQPLAVKNRDRLLQETDDPDLRKMWSITDSYKSAALDGMLKEVNQVCSNLTLLEKLPIQPSDLTETMIEPPFFSDQLQRFATICTSNYVYGAQAGNKLSYIKRNFRSQDESKYLHLLKARYVASRSQVNTNAAYTLARHSMELADMDTAGLERDCRVQIHAWNAGSRLVPLYTVEWIKGEETTVATVQVLEPEHVLEQLWVRDPQYIKRSPLTVPNREKLLEITAPK